MTKKKYKLYSPEFKRHVLKRASEDGVTDQGVCEELGISPRQLRRWRDQYRLLGDEAFPGQGRQRDATRPMSFKSRDYSPIMAQVISRATSLTGSATTG